MTCPENGKNVRWCKGNSCCLREDVLKINGEVELCGAYGFHVF